MLRNNCSIMNRFAELQNQVNTQDRSKITSLKLKSRTQPSLLLLLILNHVKDTKFARICTRQKFVLHKLLKILRNNLYTLKRSFSGLLKSLEQSLKSILHLTVTMCVFEITFKYTYMDRI